MRLLLTGSAGLVGRAAADALVLAGHALRTLDREAQPPERRSEHWPADLRDIGAVRRAVQGVDAVVHAGAIASDRRGAADDVLSVNTQGTWNVLLACAEAGVRRVVYLSSVNALGSFGGHRPSARLPIDDSYPPHPMTPYQLSKHLAEEVCRSFSDRHGIVTVCLRPMLVASADTYTRWREPAWARREDWQRRDYWAYVDLRDVCDAILAGLTVEGIAHDAFLLAARDTSMAVPTAELVDRHYPDTPWPLVAREEWLRGEPHRSLVDCGHARDRLGWEPTRSWRDAE
ncbi:MAG: NAD(P)-dependent oxidoreductase [Chthonomonadales bacterium]|nr:NAD(P)-dependent oxidoreductase [Chthonomonadales bacterium]